MIKIQPKTVTVTDSVEGYTVRGAWAAQVSWTPAGLLSLTVHFVNGKGALLDRNLVPTQVSPTAAQLATIAATAVHDGETKSAWLERASASFVAATYGLTPAPAPTPTPKPAPTHPPRRSPVT
jgi:hypothetical protein